MWMWTYESGRICSLQKVFLKLPRRCGFPKVKSLYHIRLGSHHFGELFLLLNSLHADHRTQAVHHIYDMAYDIEIIFILERLYHKTSVNLYRLGINLLQITHIGIACAEIIQRQVYLSRLQILKQLLDAVVCLNVTAPEPDFPDPVPLPVYNAPHPASYRSYRAAHKINSH